MVRCAFCGTGKGNGRNLIDEKIAKVDGFISAKNESADLRKATYEESEGWYAGITADMFG